MIPPVIRSLDDGFANRAPSEVQFGATVTTRPYFFYGSNTHAVHEAFRVRADDGRSVQIVDNVKLAPRIALAVGDRIEVRGELIPDAARGPLVHWTHHDPSGGHPDGFIDFAGRRYA